MVASPPRIVVEPIPIPLHIQIPRRLPAHPVRQTDNMAASSAGPASPAFLAETRNPYLDQHVSIAFIVIDTAFMLLFYASRYYNRKAVGTQMLVCNTLCYMLCMGSAATGICGSSGSPLLCGRQSLGSVSRIQCCRSGSGSGSSLLDEDEEKEAAMLDAAVKSLAPVPVPVPVPPQAMRCTAFASPCHLIPMPRTYSLNMITHTTNTVPVMSQIGGVGHHVAAVKPHTLQTWLQLSKVLEFTYTPAVMFAKLAALFLYHQVFEVHFYRRIIVGIGVVVVLQGVVALILAFSICRPFRYFWTQAVDVHDGTCGDVMLFYKSYSIPSLVTDVAMLVLPPG
ncbi:hypothetical protein PMIN03_008722 [Paraphaeosphaeria minitans]